MLTHITYEYFKDSIVDTGEVFTAKNALELLEGRRAFVLVGGKDNSNLERSLTYLQVWPDGVLYLLRTNRCASWMKADLTPKTKAVFFDFSISKDYVSRVETIDFDKGYEYYVSEEEQEQRIGRYFVEAGWKQAEEAEALRGRHEAREVIYGNIKGEIEDVSDTHYAYYWEKAGQYATECKFDLYDVPSRNEHLQFLEENIRQTFIWDDYKRFCQLIRTKRLLTGLTGEDFRLLDVMIWNKAFIADEFDQYDQDKTAAFVELLSVKYADGMTVAPDFDRKRALFKFLKKWKAEDNGVLPEGAQRSLDELKELYK